MLVPARHYPKNFSVVADTFAKTLVLVKSSTVSNILRHLLISPMPSSPPAISGRQPERGPLLSQKNRLLRFAPENTGISRQYSFDMTKDGAAWCLLPLLVTGSAVPPPLFAFCNLWTCRPLAVHVV